MGDFFSKNWCLLKIFLIILGDVFWLFEFLACQNHLTGPDAMLLLEGVEVCVGFIGYLTHKLFDAVCRLQIDSN